MLQSKYLTKQGLQAYLKECYHSGYNYVSYNHSSKAYTLSEEKPVIVDGVCIRYGVGKVNTLYSHFSKLVFKDLLQDKDYIKISDHIDTTDWSKVPVDTKLIVSHATGHPDYCRYFAEYKDGKVYAWDYGATSWSSDNHSKNYWEHVKLADSAAEDTNE